MAVLRAGARLRMILHAEGRPVGQLEAAVGAVEQRNVGGLRVFRQRRRLHREAVVHARDLDTAVVQPLDRVIRAAMSSEEHTSELTSLMRISYAVFCLKKKIT